MIWIGMYTKTNIKVTIEYILYFPDGKSHKKIYRIKVKNFTSIGKVREIWPTHYWNVIQKGKDNSQWKNIYGEVLKIYGTKLFTKNF